MRLWPKAKYITLKKSAGVCPDAYGKRHVVWCELPTLCLLCGEAVSGEKR